MAGMKNERVEFLPTTKLKQKRRLSLKMRELLTKETEPLKIWVVVKK